MAGMEEERKETIPDQRKLAGAAGEGADLLKPIYFGFYFY